MNMRALALGAVVGFVVAFAPSCSPAKCGPQNCDGCCDAAKNTCVKKPNNNNNTTCGSAGNACVDCATSGATCNAGQCTGTGAGGGTTGGGGGTTGGGTTGGGGGCDGCRLPNGSCVPSQTSSNNTSNCGIGGVSCASCATGELCSNGTCMPPVMMARVGSACNVDADCQAGLGAMGRCKTMTTTGSGTYTGGYCTIICSSPSQCPSGSTCIGLVPQYGEADRFCWDNCSMTDMCRTPGYGCYSLGGGVNACWLDPLPRVDAGTPANRVGEPCTMDGECQNPPSDRGVCLTNDGDLNWTGGYCSRDNCLDDDECSSDGGAMCLNGVGSGNSACVKRCASVRDGGQSDCRNGYVCEPLFFNDGGFANESVCLGRPIPAPTTVGEPCMADMDCQVPAGAPGTCISANLPDGGPSGFTGGSCTRLDCTDDSSCTVDGGAMCIVFTAGMQQFTACERRCAAAGAGQSTCRPGYVCEGLGMADGGMTSFGICQPACNAPGSGCPMGQMCNGMGYCQ